MAMNKQKASFILWLSFSLKEMRKNLDILNENLEYFRRVLGDVRGFTSTKEFTASNILKPVRAHTGHVVDRAASTQVWGVFSDWI